eukprot:scaffold12960_cov20-Prasinocladus_malaysianus.AAC.1
MDSTVAIFILVLGQSYRCQAAAQGPIKLASAPRYGWRLTRTSTRTSPSVDRQVSTCRQFILVHNVKIRYRTGVRGVKLKVLQLPSSSGSQSDDIQNRGGLLDFNSKFASTHYSNNFGYVSILPCLFESNKRRAE